MTTIGGSVFQGLVAGGTSAYLQTRAKEEVKQNSARKWMTLASQANHLFLLGAETARFAGFALGPVGTAIKVSCLLTPVALGVGLHNKEAIPFTDARIDQWNKVYKTGVIVASLATLALGNPAFAVGSLSMLAIDAYVEGKGREVFDSVKKVAAAFCLAGYAAQAALGEGLLAGANAISALVVGLKTLSTVEVPEVPPYNELRGPNAPREIDEEHCCDHDHLEDRMTHYPSSRDGSSSTSYRETVETVAGFNRATGLW